MKEERMVIMETLDFRVGIIKDELNSNTSITKKRLKLLQGNLDTAIEIYEDILLKDITEDYRDKLQIKNMVLEASEGSKYLRVALKTKANYLKLLLERTIEDFKKEEEDI